MAWHFVGSEGLSSTFESESMELKGPDQDNAEEDWQRGAAHSDLRDPLLYPPTEYSHGHVSTKFDTIHKMDKFLSPQVL